MKVRIYIIEGPSKIGKSSQSFLLSQKIEQNQIFRMDRVLTVEQITQFQNEIKSWLDADPKNTAILTGSIAFTIVSKDMGDDSFGKAYLDYDDELRDFLEMVKDYGCLAVLLKPNKYDFLDKRKEEPINVIHEDSIYKGLVHFQNYYSNANFKWTIIPVYHYDSMLQLQKKIQSHI
jgi:hypothetical protein